MDREVVVAIDFGVECITAKWRIGPQQGAESGWEAPVRMPGGRAFWETEDGHAFILEVLAVTHFPNVDVLMLTLPDRDCDAHRSRLEQAYTGLHEVRNTECRSQRLTVQVRRVAVVPQPLQDEPAGDRSCSVRT
jgi:hypothetical protein